MQGVPESIKPFATGFVKKGIFFAHVLVFFFWATRLGQFISGPANFTPLELAADSLFVFFFFCFFLLGRIKEAGLDKLAAKRLGVIPFRRGEQAAFFHIRPVLFFCLQKPCKIF